MSGSRTRQQPETVTVVVVVNHDQLKRDEVGEVSLDDTVRRRLDRGYLRLAGPTDGDGNPTPLGGTAAPVPGPVSLLGVTPGGGGTGAASGTGDGPG